MKRGVGGWTYYFLSRCHILSDTEISEGWAGDTEKPGWLGFGGLCAAGGEFGNLGACLFV
jgi:hypothetical protein